MATKTKKGKLIVIDGNDGTGKATQTALLVARLKKLGLKVKTIDFPQYQKNFFGAFIGECLAGMYGETYTTIDPHIISVLYAADRWESSEQIRRWINDGYIIVADRYVSANQIHQGGKISDPLKQKKFLTWLDTLEHKIFKIPRPDFVIYMQVPVEVSLKLLLQKGLGQKKKYLKGKKDLAENDRTYLENSRRNGMKIVKQLTHWIEIDCTKNNEIISREEIHEKVFSVVKKKLKIK